SRAGGGGLWGREADARAMSKPTVNTNWRGLRMHSSSSLEAAKAAALRDLSSGRPGCGSWQDDRRQRTMRFESCAQSILAPDPESATISHRAMSFLFPRNFRKEFPVAVGGEGSWIIAADGRRYLDASGQAAVVNIGHGVKQVAEAMAAQAGRIAFAHTTQFHSEPAEHVAARLISLATRNFRNGGRVYFTSGGSEATETAIKLARQFHLESGQSSRYRVISRRQSYHGSTLGAMSVSGNLGRRA